MSIPPSTPPPYSTPPPGGYYSTPPSRSSGGGNGWKIAGFGCLGLFLLLAIGGVLLVRNVKNSLDHPSKNSFIGMGMLAGKASLDGVHLQQAIVAYHAKHNAYPQTLIDLYSDGAIDDGKLLHNDLDDNPKPAHISWRYFPPAEGAPGNTPILEEPYHLTIGGTTAPGKITIDLDGQSESASRRRYRQSSGYDQSDSGQSGRADQSNSGGQ